MYNAALQPVMPTIALIIIASSRSRGEWYVFVKQAKTEIMLKYRWHGGMHACAAWQKCSSIVRRCCCCRPIDRLIYQQQQQQKARKVEIVLNKSYCTWAGFGHWYPRDCCLIFIDVKLHALTHSFNHSLCLWLTRGNKIMTWQMCNTMLTNLW